MKIFTTSIIAPMRRLLMLLGILLLVGCAPARAGTVEAFAPTLSPAPSPTPDPQFRLHVHPDGPLYIGDQVSFEVILQDPEQDRARYESVQVALPDGTVLASQSFGEYGLGGRYQATLIWAWDTSGYAAGDYALTFTLAPQEAAWMETITLLPQERIPWPGESARWETARSLCCTLHYVTGTAAERDLSRLLQQADEQARDAVKRMGVEFTEPITITLLPRVLGEFKAAHPEVQAHLTVANSETIESRVADAGIDVGLIESHSHLPGLQSQECCEDELVMICAPGHRLARAAAVTAEQVAAEPFVSRESGSGTREFSDAYLRTAGVATEDMNIVMELGSPEAIKGVVETGIGVAILSRATVAKEARLGRLVAVPLKPRLIRVLSLVTPREKFRSRLVTTFADFAMAKMRQLTRDA